MRLFYAVNFPAAVKDRLADIQNELRAHCCRGNFTLYENLHLTLVFVGEVQESRVKALRAIAGGLRFEPFDLRIEGVGRFRREGGDIIWAGVSENERLQALYRSLAGAVQSAGFRIDSRRYTPHLTLARAARLREGFVLADFSKKIEPITAAVTKVSLMKSERLDGRLTYTEMR